MSKTSAADIKLLEQHKYTNSDSTNMTSGFLSPLCGMSLLTNPVPEDL